MMDLWYNKHINATAQRQLPVAWPNLKERFDMSILPRFYVYILTRPDGTPFYVGKGSGHRAFDHDTEARSGHQCHKCNVIRKIWRSGDEVQRYTVFTTDDEDEAYAMEADLIALHGRANLTNGTDGGVGGRGHAVSPEVRALQSEHSKEYWNDPEYRAKIIASRFDDWADPEYRENQTDKARARWNDPEWREQMIAALRRAHGSPESRARKKAAASIHRATPKARAAMSKKWTATWADPEYRARRTFTRNCVQCGDPFSAITVTAKFCTEQCKHRFYRKNKP